LKILEV